MADALLTCTAEDTEFFMMNVTSKARPNHNKTQLKIKKYQQLTIYHNDYTNP